MQGKSRQETLFYCLAKGWPSKVSTAPPSGGCWAGTRPCLKHHRNAVSHLSTLICDAFPVLDSSNDGSNGSCPTEMKRQALCKRQSLGTKARRGGSTAGLNSHWEAQLLCFENQEVSFLQVKLTDESYNQRGVPATRFLGNTGWKALLTFS